MRTTSFNITPMLTTTLLAALLLAGCAADHPRGGEYKTLARDPSRNTDRARALNDEAVCEIKDGNLSSAEKKLKAALAADLMFGPAHNNLGNIYLTQKNYYLSAWEFQYAAKLMPNDPRPKNNLGLVFEAVGQLDKAAENFDEAVTIEQDNPEFIGNLARVYMRKGTEREKVRYLLTELVMKDTRPEWTTWAREKLAMLGGPVPTEPVATEPTEAP